MSFIFFYKIDDLRHTENMLNNVFQKVFLSHIYLIFGIFIFILFLGRFLLSKTKSIYYAYRTFNNTVVCFYVFKRSSSDPCLSFYSPYVC